MSAPSITLTATLTDLSGNPLANSGLVIALCGFYNQLPRISGTSMLAKVGPFLTKSANGVFSILLWGNDVITPAGTFYAISAVDANNNVVQAGAYQLTGSLSVDLSNLAQIVPMPPGPPIPPIPYGDIYVVVTSPSATPVFTPTLSPIITYDFTLTENATSSTASGFTEGQMVTFLIRQDGTGGWTMAWPGNMKNPPALNPAASGITALATICDQFGELIPISAATWD